MSSPEVFSSATNLALLIGSIVADLRFVAVSRLCWKSLYIYPLGVPTAVDSCLIIISWGDLFGWHLPGQIPQGLVTPVTRKHRFSPRSGRWRFCCESSSTNVWEGPEKAAPNWKNQMGAAMQIFSLKKGLHWFAWPTGGVQCSNSALAFSDCLHLSLCHVDEPWFV